MDKLEVFATTPVTEHTMMGMPIALSGQNDDVVIDNMFAAIADKNNKEGEKVKIPPPQKAEMGIRASKRNNDNALSVPRLSPDKNEPIVIEKQKDITIESEPPTITRETKSSITEKNTNPRQVKRTSKKIVIPDYLEVFLKWNDEKTDPFQEMFNYAIFFDHYKIILPDLKLKLYEIISEWLISQEYYRYVNEPFAPSFRKFLPNVIKPYVQPERGETINVLVSYMTRNSTDIIQKYDFQNFVFILSMNRTITVSANKLFQDSFISYILNNHEYYKDLKYLPSISRDLIDIMLGGRCGFYPDPLPQATYKFLNNIAETDGYPTLLGLGNVCECIKAFNDIKNSGILLDCREQLLQMEETYLNRDNVDPKIMRTIESLTNELSKLLVYVKEWNNMKTYDRAKEDCSKPFKCSTTEQTLLMLQYKINSYARMCRDHIRQMNILLQKQVDVDHSTEQTRAYLENNFPWIMY
jgi:hypothetical protein